MVPFYQHLGRLLVFLLFRRFGVRSPHTYFIHCGAMVPRVVTLAEPTRAAPQLLFVRLLMLGAPVGGFAARGTRALQPDRAASPSFYDPRLLLELIVDAGTSSLAIDAREMICGSSPPWRRASACRECGSRHI